MDVGHETGSQGNAEYVHQDAKQAGSYLPGAFAQQECIQQNGQHPKQIQPGDVCIECRSQDGGELPYIACEVIDAYPVKIKGEDDQSHQAEKDFCDQLTVFDLVWLADYLQAVRVPFLFLGCQLELRYHPLQNGEDENNVAKSLHDRGDGIPQ